jgi:hypothetical protein
VAGTSVWGVQGYPERVGPKRNLTEKIPAHLMAGDVNRIFIAFYAYVGCGSYYGAMGDQLNETLDLSPAHGFGATLVSLTIR